MSISNIVDLRGAFGPIRDQGARPTCLAFAASDAHTVARADLIPLSSEYIYHCSQKRSGAGYDEGAYLPDMLDALREDGQPIESDWPYLPAVPADKSKYIPPTVLGKIFGRNAEQSQVRLDKIYDALDNSHAVIALISLTESFFNPPNDSIIEHYDRDAVFPTPRHAVIVVGYGDSSMGRVFLVRNSWGPTWAQSGYAWLTENYLSRHMFGLAQLLDECDVSYC